VVFAHDFVAQDHRVGSAEMAIGYVQVGVADPACQNPDHFFSRSQRLRDLPVDQFQR
jgi:hypothetical protein